MPVRSRSASFGSERNAPINLHLIAGQVVCQLLPNGGGAIEQMTGLSRDDLEKTAVALARSLDQTWRADGGCRRDVWVRRMVRNRLVDVMREHNAISRANYAILNRIWSFQEELGGVSVLLSDVRASLCGGDDPEIPAKRFDEAMLAWTLAVAPAISTFTPVGDRSERKSRATNDPGFVAPHADEEERIASLEEIVRRVMDAVRSPFPAGRRALFEYVFPGLKMKAIGRALQLSESRISQVLTSVFPDTFEKALDITLEGFSRDADPPALEPAARKRLRALRKETIVIWASLPEEAQTRIVAELFPELEAPAPDADVTVPFVAPVIGTARLEVAETSSA